LASWDFNTEFEAIEAEHKIKGWSHAKKLAYIAGDKGRFSDLSRCRKARKKRAKS
jgi:predicted GIY-YIG superfamily endonuclease